MVAGSELCIDEWPVMNSGKDLGGGGGRVLGLLEIWVVVVVGSALFKHCTKWDCYSIKKCCGICEMYFEREKT